MPTERPEKVHSEKRVRVRQIHLRLTEDEFARIADQAEIANIRVTNFVRRAALATKLKPVAKYPDDVYRAIRSIGNNLNQLARKANSQERLIREEIQELESLVRGLMRCLS